MDSFDNHKSGSSVQEVQMVCVNSEFGFEDADCRISEQEESSVLYPQEDETYSSKFAARILKHCFHEQKYMHL